MKVEIFKREELLIGEEKLHRLNQAKVLIFGVGGVGGYVCEALARSGIGSFVLVDHDVVSLSNINRQIIALHSTIGRLKVEVMKERILDINPSCKVEVKPIFYLPENKSEFDFSEFDYIVDCVDTVSAKLAIIEEAKKLNIPIISSMGAGNRLDPSKIMICDLSKTSYDPLSRVMRRELKKRHIYSCKVAFSSEIALTPRTSDELNDSHQCKRSIPGSSAFVPSAFGLIIASEVVKDLIQ